MKAKQMQLAELPSGPVEEWSVASMLFAALSSVLAALLYLYRGREVEHTQQLTVHRSEISELKTWVKELQDKAEECHNDRVTMMGQLIELRQQMQQFKGSQ